MSPIPSNVAVEKAQDRLAMRAVYCALRIRESDRLSGYEGLGERSANLDGDDFAGLLY